MNEPISQDGFSILQLWESIKLWVLESGRWYLASMFTHMVIFIVLGLVLGTIHHVATRDEVAFDAVEQEPLPEAVDLGKFEVGETPLDPSELNTETLTQFDAQPLAQDAQYNDDSDIFEEAGGGRPMEADDLDLGGAGMELLERGPGPVLDGEGGVGAGIGTGENPGSGGAGSAWGGRGSGHRDKIMAGATKASERAVAAALNWLALHQNPNGSWSLDHFHDRCRYGRCSGAATVNSDSAATAMALLPFLAAGQTHKSKGPYQRQIAEGLRWLVTQQRADGDLSGETVHQMYSHGLAAITLCEAYGMTQDSWLRTAAQGAIDFIQAAQNTEDGGWRYRPGDRGDTSVVGWQMMALKSGQMAGLVINDATFQGVDKFLKTVSHGRYEGQYSYQPNNAATYPLTAVGLLCRQYLGVRGDDPSLTEGTGTLMVNLPDVKARNVYYWYYATQVMHNQPGPEWETWNRKMRRLLIDTQEKEGCEAGSWDPEAPEQDTWGRQGGRIMMTSLSCLTLEIYYRYLPIYKLDKQDAAVADADSGKPDEAQSNPLTE